MTARVATYEPEARRLALAELGRSGLDQKCLNDGTGMRALSRAEALRHAPDLLWWRYAREGLRCLLFEYADLDGKPTGIWRLRRLEEVPGPVELPRYLGPTGVRPGVWLSRSVKWREALAKPEASVIVTEGEKKSELLCRAGLLALGLAGVWSTSSKRHRLEVLPELLGIPWEGRRVVVMFDADEKPRTRMQVAQAAARFGDFARSQGAEVFKATLPLLELERKAS